jgi:hypothetical protein
MKRSNAVFVSRSGVPTESTFTGAALLMNERRLRAYVDELELTAALLAYVNTVDPDIEFDVDGDVDGDGDGDDPPRSTPPPGAPGAPVRLIPLRRPSPPRGPV